MLKAAFVGSFERINNVYAGTHRERIAAKADLHPEIIEGNRVQESLAILRDVDCIFSTWGMPSLSADILEQLTKLKVVLYAAGSVQGFAQPLLERGIQVSSAWGANATTVAEFVLAEVLLSCKGYYRNQREFRADPTGFNRAYRGPGNVGATIALLGAGAVGRAVIEQLKRFEYEILVFDPFLDEAKARALGVAPVSLTDAFERGFVVSNHLADKPEIAGMINADLLSRMRPGATFINSGRGRTVNEADLIATLIARPDLTALLDVTHPEPTALDSAFHQLPNVFLTTHIAGANNEEWVRLANCAVEEFERFVAGEPLLSGISLEMLPRLA